MQWNWKIEIVILSLSRFEVYLLGLHRMHDVQRIHPGLFRGTSVLTGIEG
jgi:hypothetical protein